MNIVIPMAGLGSRFTQSGFLLPKPLINIGNKPMYRFVTDSLPLELASNVVFILRKDAPHEIEEDIRKNYRHLSKYSITKIKKTEGQAETVLQGSMHLDFNKPTLVHNCDTYIKEDFNWKGLLKKNVDGAIVLFSSNEDRWSYAQLDSQKKYVVDIQEKKIISPYASTGTYFFKDTKALLKTIQFNLDNNIRENNEFYLSSVYRSMLHEKKKIIPIWTKSMLCFGTPQDLTDSLNQLILSK